MLKTVTFSPAQTRKFGEVLAKQILKTKQKKKPFVIGLIGDLGGGKTTFLQGFAKGLGIRERILSPTFLILKKFKIPNKKIIHWFYHIDCCRIKNPKEILALGFKEIVKDSQNIVAIEWADRIQKILPKDTLILEFKFFDRNKRKIEMFST